MTVIAVVEAGMTILDISRAQGLGCMNDGIALTPERRNRLGYVSFFVYV